MSGAERFEHDLMLLLSRLTSDAGKDVENKLTLLKDCLVTLRKENVVKINHSVMELVCAKFLIKNEYEVQLEHQLSEILTCDLYAVKGLGNLIVEIETGFIPPEYALTPLTYTSARLASKIIRYSSFAGKFVLGVPPHYILPFPPALAKPPRKRTPEEIRQIKKLCDKYYSKPPVTIEDIQNARIQEIYIIDVDLAQVQEIEPERYLKRAMKRGVIYSHLPTENQSSETKEL